MVRALRDPDGANLDRIQIVKGGLDAEGATHEKIWDIACAGRTIVDGACESDVGNTVDVGNASWTNTIGAAVLGGYWEDAQFDPTQKVFYYVRAIQVPTPRWTAYGARFFGIDMPDGTPMTCGTEPTHRRSGTRRRGDTGFALSCVSWVWFAVACPAVSSSPRAWSRHEHGRST